MQPAGLPFTNGVCSRCGTSGTGSQAVARDLFSLAPEGFLEAHKPRASETRGNSILQPRGTPGPTLPPQTGRAGNGTSRPRLSGDQRPLSSPVIIQGPVAPSTAGALPTVTSWGAGTGSGLANTSSQQSSCPAQTLLRPSPSRQPSSAGRLSLCWTVRAEGRAHSASLTSCLGSDTACAP